MSWENVAKARHTELLGVRPEATKSVSGFDPFLGHFWASPTSFHPPKPLRRLSGRSKNVFLDPKKGPKLGGKSRQPIWQNSGSPKTLFLGPPADPPQEGASPGGGPPPPPPRDPCIYIYIYRGSGGSRGGVGSKNTILDLPLKRLKGFGG